jgi:hypothetical protein
MDAKWPFMLITLGLLILLGISISTIEKSSVLRNWNKRRCEFPVMAAGMFFKPKDDPRSSSQFASDNFTFCMKSYVEKFIELAFSPFQAVFSKHTAIAGDAMNMLGTLRNITKAMYDAFLGFMQPFFRRFTASIYEMGRIVQYLRMAVRRANAVMMSMLYQGLTMFRGMINTIQFIIKVVLIICGIMLAIIIILIFILFPFIPLILSVLGAIIATILGMIMVISGSVDKAVSMKQGFCFGKSTKIFVKAEDGSNKLVSVSQVKLGDELAHNCGKVTAVIRMEGNDIKLYNLKGIFVSGTHVVETEDKDWKLVAEDKRSIKTEQTSSILYCFNTTTNKIPIYAPELVEKSTKNRVIFFRDWEEIPDEDLKGQYGWNYTILKTLNNSSNYMKWKDGLSRFNNTPLLSEDTLIKTMKGYISLKEIQYKKTTEKVVDRYGQEQFILGVVDAYVENVDVDINNKSGWHTELYEWDKDNNIWIKGISTINPGNKTLKGKTLITSKGEIIIWDNITKSEKVIRDFTDIGYNSIHQTYSYVAERLRLYR